MAIGAGDEFVVRDGDRDGDEIRVDDGSSGGLTMDLQRMLQREELGHKEGHR